MRVAVIPGILLAFVACGGSDNSTPTEEQLIFRSTGLASSTGNPNPNFEASGDVPVHYINKDTVSHQASSSECPEINSTVLAPNQEQVTHLTAPKFCNITDTQKPGDPAFSMTLTVRQPPAGGGGGGGGGPGHLSENPRVVGPSPR